MTIAATPRLAGPYVGNGSTPTFPFSFAVLDPGDLYLVVLTAPSGITVLTLTKDYTVTLNADQDTSPGGSITMLSLSGAPQPLLAGYSLVITTNRPLAQNVEVTNGGAFYPDVINTALDVLMVLLQQVALQVSRCLQDPIVDGTPAVMLPPAAVRANNLLGFDAEGNVAMVAAAGTVSGGGGGGGGSTTTIVVSAVPSTQEALGTVDGVNALFTFTAPATPTPAPMVYAGGVYQAPGIDYENPVRLLSGTTWQITFDDTSIPQVEPIAIVLFQ